MKKLLLFGALAFGLNSFGQGYIISNSEVSTLYRGYKNLVNFGTLNGFSGYKLEVDNGSLSKSEDGSQYILKPTGRKNTCTVTFLDTVNNKEMNKVVFNVQNLPDPILYWGGTKSGGRASKSQTRLFAKYGPEIPLNVSFKISRMEVLVPGQATITCEGGTLSQEAINAIRNSAEETISIIALMVGPDGIVRQIVGTWTIK